MADKTKRPNLKRRITSRLMENQTTKSLELAEQRERQRSLLRGVEQAIVNHVAPTGGAPDTVVERRLRAAADVLLTDETFRAWLQQRSEAEALAGAQAAVGCGNLLGRDARQAISTALGTAKVDADFIPHENTPAGDRYIAYVALALAADLVSIDGYRDPRVAVCR